MTEPTTVNIALIAPNTGDLVDVWGANALNPDLVAIDGFLGGTTTISVSNAPITLTVPAGFTATPSAGPTQAQNGVLKLSGTTSGSVVITLPMPGFYIVDTLGLGVTSTNVVLLRAVGSGEIVGLPFREARHIYNDGTNVRFANLAPVGTYLDYAGSGVPLWITSCTVPPFLLCDGSTFNATTYPLLNSILGGNTLPDFRGRSGFYVNGGSGRLTTAGAGIDGNTLLAVGGNNGVSLAANQIPAGVPSSNASQAISVASANNVVQNAGIISYVNGGGGGTYVFTAPPLNTPLTSTGTNNITVTSTNAGQVIVPSTTPGIVGGIRMIRAA